MVPKACQICLWWNPYVFEEFVGPYPIHYLPFLLKESFEVEILTKSYPFPNELLEILERKGLKNEYPEKELESCHGVLVRRFQGGRTISFFKLLKHLLRNNYSLVHLHSLSFFEDLGISLLRNQPMIFTHHAASLPDVLSVQDPRHMILRNSLRAMSATGVLFTALTQYQARLYRNIGINRVVVIPHAMDLSSFKVKRKRGLVSRYLGGEFNILHVGLFEPRKGQEILIRCLPKIGPSVNLILVGKNVESSYAHYLKELSRKIGVEKRVHFLRAWKEELIQLYLHSDLFAFPTTGEIFGHVYLEAMAAGCPIITTDKPVAREILQDGKAGMLVERSVEGFTKGILELLSDENKRKKMAREGRKAVEEKFELKKILKKWRKLYRSFLDS